MQRPTVRVNPRLRSPVEADPPARIRLTLVGDWEAVCSPGIRGLCGLLRKRMIGGERALVLHGQLAVDVAEEPPAALPDLRLPLDAALSSVDRVGEALLRLSLVRDLVTEGLPAVAMSGVDLGLLRRGADGVLRVDESRLAWLLGGGVLPVLGVDCLNADGTVGRATAPEVTQALALARDLHSVDVVSRTDRVLRFDGSQALTLSLGDLQRLRTRGPDHFPSDPVSHSVIELALAALESGVPTARIGSVASLVSRTATEVTQSASGVVMR